MRTIVLAAILLAPLALAQPDEGIDATISLAPGAPVAIDAPEGLARVGNATDGERYEIHLALDKPQTTIEVRASGFDIERPRQIVPSLALDESEYPLFEPYPSEDVWDIDGPARIAHAGGTADDVRLRLGIPGPANVTLVLTRDVQPPTFTLGAIVDITHIGFYQETNTEELALADLQVRAVGDEEWVRNPTPTYHFRQNFPVQGLDAETEHEARVVFTDWAENVATSDTYRVTTAAKPDLPTPVVTPVSPAPNSTINFTFTTLRARVESPDSPLLAETLAVFFDKRAVQEGVRFRDGEVQYTTPAPMAPGKHFFAVEVQNEAGGKGEANWSFFVEEREAPRGTPAAPLLALLAVLALTARARRA